jgi:beta-lactamase regulating signal transducer with metallopeptidase domain
MTGFLVQPAGVRLTWSLVHFLWQGAVIAALLLILLRSLSTLRPRGRYLWSMAALGLMAVCPFATWVVLGQVEPSSTTHSSIRVPSEYDVESTSEANVSATLASDSGTTFKQLVPALQPYLLFAWLMGVLLLGGRLVTGYLGTLWLKNGRTKVPQVLANKAIEIGRRLGVNATGRVFACSRVAEAVAIGFWKPIVLVPVCWLTELPPTVLEAVIAHELAHIRRWDLWATLVQRVIETLLFYHPAVWWLSRRVSLEREMCCDELAVMATGRPVVYAQVLEYLGGRTAAVTSLVLAASFKGERDMNLLTRVQQVLGMRTRPESGRVWLAGVLSLILALGVLTLSMGQASRRAIADDKPATERREGDRKVNTRDAPDGEIKSRRSVATGDADRKPTEGESRRSAAGGERKAEPSALDNFEPQNAREESLYKMIVQLRKETAELRRQINQTRGGAKEESIKDTIRRGGDQPNRPAAREGDSPVRRESRDGKTIKPGPRDGDERKVGPRDGDERKPGPRDGDERKTGSREGDGDKPVRRDGEERKSGPRDGEGDKPKSPDRVPE